MTGRDLTTVERMECGALSGLFAQTLTYPLEVTRRRMQTIGIVATSGKDAAVDLVGKAHGHNPTAEQAIRTLHPHHPPPMGAIVRELYQEQGIRGFFKGVSLNWFKGPIAFSIRYVVFVVVVMLNFGVALNHDLGNISHFLSPPFLRFLILIFSFTAFDMLQSKMETSEERRLRMPRRRTTAAIKP